jgi:hypothetical protein
MQFERNACWEADARLIHEGSLRRGVRFEPRCDPSCELCPLCWVGTPPDSAAMVAPILRKRRSAPRILRAAPKSDAVAERHAAVRLTSTPLRGRHANDSTMFEAVLDDIPTIRMPSGGRRRRPARSTPISL